MKIKQNQTILIIIIVAFSVTGCGAMRSYEGPKLADDKIAVIQECGPPTCFVWQGNEGRIAAVDGKKLSIADNKVEVLPGKHNIAIDIIVHRTTVAEFVRQNLILETKAGHVYSIHGSSGCAFCSGKSINAWIIDTGTDEVVAGISP